MAVKLTVQALFVYGAMLAYLAAFVAFFLKARRAGGFFYAAGFTAALAGFAYRWIDVKHVPLQNLFEVFLCLGVLALPISILCRRLLEVGGEAGDALVAFVVLFPAGFVFKAEPEMLPPALQSWLFAPHVLAYMLAYMIFAKAGVQAIQGLFHKGGAAEGLVEPELGAYRVVLMGFPLLTLGLVLGAWWGKLAWGDYWSWDPKELWSLITWLVYVGYLHFRYMYRAKYPRANSLIVLGGTAAIVLTLLWVNLAARFASGLHSYAK
jgi:ABC-type transport system involved in cytochrome c biogenesis permease subunit